MKNQTSHRDPYAGTAPREVPAYTLFDASRYLQIPHRTVHNWTFGYTYGTTAGKRRSASIIEPADPERHLLSFVNVLELHIIDVMRWQHGLDVKKIRRAYQYMQDTLGQKRPFADVDLETDRVDVFARYLGKLVAVSRYGQVSLKELLEIHLNRIERDTSGLGVRLFPFVQKKRPEPERLRSVPRMIAMDPRIAFGRPVITGSRIATFEIAERYKAGDSIANLATDYDRPSEEIEEAIRIELTLEPAA